MKKMKLKNLLKNNLCVLLIAVLVFSLCSCGGNMTDESAKAELERLLPVSYELNEIFWGKGLPTKLSESSYAMQPVTDDCGYKSVDDIIKKAKTVFSEEYVEEIVSAILTDGDDTNARYADIDGVLKADLRYPQFDVKGNIVISTAKIKKQNSRMMIVTAEYEDGGSTELTLIMQDGKWYLDSPTY